MSIVRPAMLAALAVLANIALTVTLPNGAQAQECVPQRQIISEVVLIDGMVRTRVHTSGYCNPWEAIADGLLVVFNDTDRMYRASTAILAAAMKAAQERASGPTADDLLITAAMTFRKDPNCPIGTSVPNGCPSPLGTLKFVSPIAPITIATKN